jgi:hypothetical protein
MPLRARGQLPGVDTTSMVGNTTVQVTLDLGADSEQASAATCDSIERPSAAFISSMELMAATPSLIQCSQPRSRCMIRGRNSVGYIEGVDDGSLQSRVALQ